jgi:dTDP-4-dehydrorhamnose reductase
VVHCAGVCDLDVCEERPRWARRLNVEGTRAVAEVFGDRPILYMSTDLVFSGEDTPPGGYTESHPTAPVSVAGRTFAEAEMQLNPERACVVRLGLPLGCSIHGDKGAVDWIESRFKRALPVTLFYDEIRSCPSCDEVGQVAVAALCRGLTGLYHCGGRRRWTLYEIGDYVLQRGGYDTRLLKGQYRHQEVNGPPRIGDVSLDSRKLKRDLIG